MRRALTRAFVLAGFLAAGGSRAEPAPSWMMPELLAAAQTEGQVTVYASSNEQEVFSIWKMFENATDVRVNHIRGADGPLIAANFSIGREARQMSAKSGRLPTRDDVESTPPDVIQRPRAKKFVPISLDGEKSRAAQKLFDQIFKGRWPRSTTTHFANGDQSCQFRASP